jgi:outer membrane receptor protein involved in Fe transport
MHCKAAVTAEWGEISMRLTLLLACCTSLTALSGVAYAQQTTAPASGEVQADSDEIVVTASKGSEQTVLEAPLAIQALSGEQLAERNISNLDGLITAVPGASQGEQLGEFLRSYSIRGSATGGGAGDAVVGYYLDDTPYVIPNAPFAPQPRLIDLDRVEILRGPYGTLYGAGAMGGTIIFHTRNPDLQDFTADGETYVGSTRGTHEPNYGVAGAVSIPLIEDELALRISGGVDYRAGYADVYEDFPATILREGDANDSEHRDLHAVMLWQPSSDLGVRFQYQHFSGDQGYSQQMASVDPYFYEGMGPDLVGYEKTNNNLYGVTVDWDLGFATLTSSTGYVNFDTSYMYPLYYPILGGTGELFNGYDGYSFSQEARLASNGEGPLHWLAGVFYNDAENTFSQLIDFPVPFLNGYGETMTHTENVALFGEVSYDLLGGKLVPLAGVRVYHDDRNFETTLNGAVTGEGASDPTVTTWRANLSYYPNSDTTLYFNAGTGFRSGIVQSQQQSDALALDGIDEGTALQPDRMRNFELGLKGRVSNGRISYEVNLYDLQYEDIQSGLVTTSGLAAFASLGTARIQGLDLALQWEPVDGLTFAFAGDVNNAEYESVNPLVAAGVSAGIGEGTRLLNHPRWTARFDVGYETPINAEMSFYTNASASLTDGRINQFGDETEQLAMFDGNIGIRTGAYDFELFGQNLSDEAGPWFIRSTTPSLVGGPVPRTIGLRARFHYQ